MILLNTIQAVFIDRDGTIGGNGHFVHPKVFTPYLFSQHALEMLKEKGFKLFAFTNQYRISSAEASISEFQKSFCHMDSMMLLFVPITQRKVVFAISPTLVC